MKIFNAEQIRSADLFTIENQPISSINLIEKAALACVSWIDVHLQKKEKFAIFCGLGNNGGDGFAIARILYQKGFDVDVFTDIKNLEKQSADCKTNFLKLKEFSGIDILEFEQAYHFNFCNATIIDALFGVGLNRKLDGKIKDLIEFLNLKNCLKIAVDLPSGLSPDQYFGKEVVILKADITLSFQFCKKTFLHPETAVFCGKIQILDIGLSKEFIQKEKTENFVIDEELINEIYKPRQDFSHKGNFGKACLISGSFGKIGAAVLATKASLRTGSGITLALAPKCGYEILQTQCPEAMFLYGGKDFVSQFPVEEDFTCGIGPGLGTDPETEDSFITFLENYQKPLVLDADALNILAKNQEYLKLIPENSIITPHPKEFERLFGKFKNSFERLEKAKEISKELQIFMVLKDHYSQVITPDQEVFYNINGNSGMAKGGSGDVLTGIITSLLAQKYSSRDAAIFGVWLHGKAGDFAAEKFSKEAMLASDLIKQIPKVFKILKN